MYKYVKGALIFTGGVAVGTVVGAGLVVVKALESKEIRKVIANKIGTVVFGEESIRKESNHKSYSYYCTARQKDLNGVVIGIQKEAENILDNMKQLLSDYNHVTIADYLNLCGLVPLWGDEMYGWLTLDHATVVEVKDGFTIELPRPMLIK